MRNLLGTTGGLALLSCVALHAACGNEAPSKPPALLVDQLLSEKGLEELVGTTLQVYGEVSPGSIEVLIAGDSATHRFTLEHNGAKLQIRSAGPLPDGVRDQGSLIVTGKLRRADNLYVEATEIMGGLCVPDEIRAATGEAQPAWCPPPH